jgi:Ser/Thr protein kinase RdoA (MazF antagonist)
VTHPEEADEIHRYLTITREQLNALDAEHQPAQLIHGDFHTRNLLYRGGELAGIMDLDLVHVNHRIADFAISWRGMHDEVVRGYEDESPLEAVEWELLTPVYRAWYLMTAQRRLAPSYDRNPQFGYLIGNLSREPALPLVRRRHGNGTAQQTSDC